MRRTRPLMDRFIDKLVVMPNGCWQWTAATKENGYGVIGVPDSHVYAHRAAYELFIGPIPDGLEIDHLCRERSYVNPSHLEAVTHQENVLRGESLSAQRARVTHCPSGHEYDGENTYVWRGMRRCRRCNTQARREYVARNREKVNAKKRADYHRRKATA